MALKYIVMYILRNFVKEDASALLLFTLLGSGAACLWLKMEMGFPHHHHHVQLRNKGIHGLRSTGGVASGVGGCYGPLSGHPDVAETRRRVTDKPPRKRLQKGGHWSRSKQKRRTTVGNSQTPVNELSNASQRTLKHQSKEWRLPVETVKEI